MIKAPLTIKPQDGTMSLLIKACATILLAVWGQAYADVASGDDEILALYQKRLSQPPPNTYMANTATPFTLANAAMMANVNGINLDGINPNTSDIFQNTLPTQPLDNLTTTSLSVSDNFYHQALAKYALQQINQAPQIHDPWVVDRVYHLTDQLSKTASRHDLLAVPIIYDNHINAFAVAGGLIGLNTGTILATDSMDELASVLSHEIAHLSLRHYDRTHDNKSTHLAMQIGGLLATIAMSTINANAAAAAMIGTQTVGAEARAAQSRSHEREADRVGMQILAKAGFDVRAMPQFLAKLQQKSILNHSNSFIPSFVQSHPMTDERLSYTKSQSLAYPAINPIAQTLHQQTFDLLYWRVQYLTYASEEQLKMGAKSSTGAKLAYVAYLADRYRFDDAKRLFDSIAQSDHNITDEPLYCITQAHIAHKQANFVDASQILAACHAVYPERRDLAVYLADSWFLAGEYQQTIDLLTDWANRYQHDLVSQNLLQKSHENLAKLAQDDATKNHHTAYALIARSQIQRWRGQFDGALSSLYQAQHISNKATLLKQIDEHISDVKAYQSFGL